MPLVDRYRVVKTIELSALDRKLKGPERLLREGEVSNHVKTTYDDASGAGRAEFMALIKKMPLANFPWSAVSVAAPAVDKGKGGPGDLIVVPKPASGAGTTPAILALLRSQVDTPEADPGNRIPERGSFEGLEFEPLYAALDTWNTSVLLKWASPQGWAVPGSGAPKEPLPPDGLPNPGVVPPKSDPAGTQGAPAQPAPGPVPPPPPLDDAALVPGPKWPQTAVLVAGGVTLAVVVGTSVYWLTSRHDTRRLEDALRGGARPS